MDESDRRIVILGKTGAGKSCLANTIFGEDLFTVGHTFNSETRECKAETKSVKGRNFTFIDTPGFFDTDGSEEEMKPEIVRCITECAPGPHAFLIVLKVDRFTEQEEAVIHKIQNIFSEEVFKYATVVFTHGEQLRKGQRIQENFSKNKLVSDLVKKCGGRCHVIDNKYWNRNPEDEYRSNQFQVEQLLKTIDKMVEENKGSCYTNEMLQAVEEEIQREEENIRKSSGNMSEEKIREQAKSRVAEKFLISLAGIATGVVLGALLGAAEAVLIVVTIFKKIVNQIGLVGTVAAAGGAAGVTGGIVAGVVIGTGAAVGAVIGGVTGYQAAEEAETAREAAKKAAAAVMDGAQSLSEYHSQSLNRVKNLK